MTPAITIVIILGPESCALGIPQLRGNEGTSTCERMNKGIPLVKIADRVEVSVNLKAKRVSGPPATIKQ